MKTFCKLTAQSPAASYVPLPRSLLQDEALRDISNDAKVLYALLLDRASISRQNGYVEPDGTIRLYSAYKESLEKKSMGFMMSEWDEKLLKYGHLFEPHPGEMAQAVRRGMRVRLWLSNLPKMN